MLEPMLANKHLCRTVMPTKIFLAYCVVYMSVHKLLKSLSFSCRVLALCNDQWFHLDKKILSRVCVAVIIYEPYI